MNIIDKQKAEHYKRLLKMDAKRAGQEYKQVYDDVLDYLYTISTSAILIDKEMGRTRRGDMDVKEDRHKYIKDCLKYCIRMQCEGENGFAITFANLAMIVLEYDEKQTS